MSFADAGGRYTHTNQQMDAQQTLTKVYEKVIAKHKADWAAYMALPQQRDDELVALMVKMRRNWMVFHEQKAKTARLQF
jgi:hypothetical protein